MFLMTVSIEDQTPRNRMIAAFFQANNALLNIIILCAILFITDVIPDIVLHIVIGVGVGTWILMILYGFLYGFKYRGFY